MIILFTMEKRHFVIIIYKLLVQKMFKRRIKDCVKINGNERIKIPEKD